jgi:hypothetical protein
MPAKASAKVSFRLVGKQDPAAIRDAFRAYRAGPGAGRLLGDLPPPWRQPALHHPDRQPGAARARPERALEAEWGKPAVVIGMGGSIPIVGDFQKMLGMDILARRLRAVGRPHPFAEREIRAALLRKGHPLVGSHPRGARGRDEGSLRLLRLERRRPRNHLRRARRATPRHRDRPKTASPPRLWRRHERHHGGRWRMRRALRMAAASPASYRNFSWIWRPPPIRSASSRELIIVASTCTSANTRCSSALDGFRGAAGRHRHAGGDRRGDGPGHNSAATRKPCALIDTAGYWTGLAAFLDHQVEEGFVRAPHRGMLMLDDDPARLLDRMEAYEPPVVTKWIKAGER